MDAATLTTAINDAGCPTISVTLGKADDRSTWSFEPPPENTQAQNDAGNNVIATIPIDTLNTALPTGEFISRFSNAEYRKLQDQRMTDNGKLGKDWDNVTSDPQINMTKKKTQTLKSSLVADGVLTQTRADEIFS